MKNPTGNTKQGRRPNAATAKSIVKHNRTSGGGGIGPSTMKKSPENPFDKFANARNKHEVINRRVKGEDRNVGRARKQALESRKTRLVQDFESIKKTNSFADKRFGEGDADLSLEDKMFLRFQKERIKKARNASLFNLDGGDQDEHVLTHKGQVLSASNAVDEDWHSDDEDDTNGKLGKDIVNSLHFGGGFVPKAGSGGEEAAGALRKTRLDALQEIVMKSKLHKMQKKEAKEEQETEREKLDKDFKDLVSHSMLDFRPTKREKGYDEAAQGVKSEWDDYDSSLRAMAFEAKARPSDRTKSAEELATEARTKLEELEAARLRRMNAAIAPDDADAVEAAFSAGIVGGKKKPFADTALAGQQDASMEDRGGKKRKRITDDEVDGSFGSSFAPSTTKASGKNRRRAKDEDKGEEDDEEGEDNEENDEDEEDDEDDEEEDDDDWEDDDFGMDTAVKSASKSVADEEDIEDDDEDDDDKDELDGKGKDKDRAADVPVVSDRAAKRLKQADKRVQQLSSEGVNEQMPHKLTCPSTLEEFDRLKHKYVRSVPDLRELITRILAWNSVHLPGAVGAENKGKMHNFLDVLLKVFCRVGDSLALVKTVEADAMAQLDFLCTAIYRLNQDLPDASPLLWGRTLKFMHGQLQKRLRDFVQGERNESCWPSLGHLLMLRLVGHVFAVTDYEHALVGPASLLLCQCLSQCPVRTAADVASGLLSCSVLAGFTRETKRLVPEAFEFLRSVMVLFCPTTTISQPAAASSSSSTSRSSSSSSSSSTASKDKRKVVAAVALSGPPQKTFDVPSATGNNSSSQGHALQALRSAAARLGRAKQSSSSSSSSSSKNEDSGGSSGGGLQIIWTAFGKERSGDQSYPAIAAGLLHTAQRLASDLALRHAEVSAFPELFTPLTGTLRALRPQDAPVLPLTLQRSHADLLEVLLHQASECSQSRAPLQWRKQATVAIETKNPRFQADYTFKKDRDPDESRAKLKQLTRQSKRETKAAMRELRRDSEFVGQLQFAEQTAKREKLQAERHKNYAWMESEAATINEQVRKGGEMLRGGGSGVAKKARVKR